MDATVTDTPRKPDLRAGPGPDAERVRGAVRLPLHMSDVIAANARGERVASLPSLGGSILMHLLLIALLLWLGARGVLQVTTDLGVGTGIGAGAAGGGGGGGADEERITYIRIPEPAPAAAEPTLPALEPVPVPEVTPPQQAVPQPAAPAVVADAGTGGGAGSGQGTGTGAGQGPGSGGGSGGGEGGGIGSGVGPGIGKGRIMAPSPTVLLLPPPAPRSLRGDTVVVRLAVDSIGGVTAVELVPPTGDRKFNDKLRKAALGWKFRPARDPANRPVPVVFDVTFTF